jgi:hypothetical protein
MFCVCGILAGAHRGVAHRTELELLGGRALAGFVIRLARGDPSILAADTASTILQNRLLDPAWRAVLTFPACRQCRGKARPLAQRVAARPLPSQVLQFRADPAPHARSVDTGKNGRDRATLSPADGPPLGADRRGSECCERPSAFRRPKSVVRAHSTDLNQMAVYRNTQVESITCRIQ